MLDLNFAGNYNRLTIDGWHLVRLWGFITDGQLVGEVCSVGVIFAISLHLMCLEVFVVPVALAFVTVEHDDLCEEQLHNFIWLLHLDILFVADSTRVNVRLVPSILRFCVAL